MRVVGLNNGICLCRGTWWCFSNSGRKTPTHVYREKILCTPRLRMSTAFARSLHSLHVLYAIVQTRDCRHDICLIFCIPHQPTTQMCQEGRPHGFQGVEAILLEGWAYQPTMWIHKFLGNWDLAQNHQELVIFFRLRFSGLNKKNMAT